MKLLWDAVGTEFGGRHELDGWTVKDLVDTKTASPSGA